MQPNLPSQPAAGLTNHESTAPTPRWMPHGPQAPCSRQEPKECCTMKGRHVCTLLDQRHLPLICSLLSWGWFSELILPHGWEQTRRPPGLPSSCAAPHSDRAQGELSCRFVCWQVKLTGSGKALSVSKFCRLPIKSTSEILPLHSSQPEQQEPRLLAITPASPHASSHPEKW